MEESPLNVPDIEELLLRLDDYRASRSGMSATT